MNALRTWIIAGLACMAATAFAQGPVYDSYTGLLTLPAVQVGTATYTNVTLLNTGNYTFRLQTATEQLPPGVTDVSYDGATGLLSIPAVAVGDITYVNVTLANTGGWTFSLRTAYALTSITILGVPSASLMPGNSTQLSAIANYPDPSATDVSAQVSWSTTDASVLTASAAGRITAEAPGQADVIASLSGVSGRASLQVVPLQVSAYELRLTGDPEVMIADGQFGLHHVPDGHMTFRRTPLGIDLWLQGAGGAVRLQGPSFEALTPNPSSYGNAVPVFLPSGSGFDRDYAGPGSVLTATNGKDLLMIYHAEYQCGSYGTPFTAGIGLARSTDGGLTWTRQGQIVSSSYQPPPCTATRLNGAGVPVVILSRDRDYYYMYYMEWLPNRPDETYLARSPVSADAVPGSWTKYYRGEFSQPGLGGLGDPVIHRPPPEDVTIWAGFASVSYNTVLQRYLAVFLTTPEFYYTASEDGIHWEPARKLGLLASSIPGYPEGTWLCYPSLLSLDQPNDGTTSDHGYFYYSHGIRNVTPHYMERRAFQIFR